MKRIFKFGLVHQFIFAAAITITLAMGLLAYLVSGRFKASVMQAATQEGALLIEAFLEPAVQELANSSTLSLSATKQLDDLLQGKLGDRVPSVKIWLRDGTLAYATNKKLVGQKFPSAHLNEAFDGKISGSFDELEDPENFHERNLAKPLIEIYAPLYKIGTRDIIAIGEFYNDGERLNAELNSIRLAIASIVGAVGAPMMFLLFLMVRRTASLVNRHREDLVRKIAEAETLADQNDRLRRVAEEARLESARSNEILLGQIGRDLHDGPIQLLSLLMLKLTGGSEVPKNGSNEGSDGEGNSNLHELTRRILADLRNIATGLVLPELQSLTTTETLWLAVRQHEAMTGTQVACEIGGLPQYLSSSLKICLYRIVQEGLNNAFHHANARGQSVRASADTRWISIVVQDAGIKTSDHGTHGTKIGLGISGLRSRVEAFHGVFEISINLDSGTEMTAKLPYI